MNALKQAKTKQVDSCSGLSISQKLMFVLHDSGIHPEMGMVFVAKPRPAPETMLSFGSCSFRGCPCSGYSAASSCSAMERNEDCACGHSARGWHCEIQGESARASVLQTADDNPVSRGKRKRDETREKEKEKGIDKNEEEEGSSAEPRRSTEIAEEDVRQPNRVAEQEVEEERREEREEEQRPKKKRKEKEAVPRGLADIDQNSADSEDTPLAKLLPSLTCPGRLRAQLFGLGTFIISLIVLATRI